MAVKVYTPGQFYAAGGVVEEMFYQEVGRTKKYISCLLYTSPSPRDTR